MNKKEREEIKKIKEVLKEMTKGISPEDVANTLFGTDVTVYSNKDFNEIVDTVKELANSFSNTNCNCENKSNDGKCSKCENESKEKDDIKMFTTEEVNDYMKKYGNTDFDPFMTKKYFKRKEAQAKSNENSKTDSNEDKNKDENMPYDLLYPKYSDIKDIKKVFAQAKEKEKSRIILKLSPEFDNHYLRSVIQNVADYLEENIDLSSNTDTFTSIENFIKVFYLCKGCEAVIKSEQEKFIKRYENASNMPKYPFYLFIIHLNKIVIIENSVSDLGTCDSVTSGVHIHSKVYDYIKTMIMCTEDDDLENEKYLNAKASLIKLLITMTTGDNHSYIVNKRGDIKFSLKELMDFRIELEDTLSSIERYGRDKQVKIKIRYKLRLPQSFYSGVQITDTEKIYDAFVKYTNYRINDIVNRVYKKYNPNASDDINIVPNIKIAKIAEYNNDIILREYIFAEVIITIPESLKRHVEKILCNPEHTGYKIKLTSPGIFDGDDIHEYMYALIIK